MSGLACVANAGRPAAVQAGDGTGRRWYLGSVGLKWRESSCHPQVEETPMLRSIACLAAGLLVVPAAYVFSADAAPAAKPPAAHDHAHAEAPKPDADGFY